MKALKILKSAEQLGFSNKQIIISEYKLNKAIKELEELQNRSCYNCKYILDTETIGNFCEYNDRCSDERISVDYVSNIKDFYCSKWEQK